jgi:hypothetical protein
VLPPERFCTTKTQSGSGARQKTPDPEAASRTLTHQTTSVSNFMQTRHPSGSRLTNIVPIALLPCLAGWRGLRTQIGGLIHPEGRVTDES